MNRNHISTMFFFIKLKIPELIVIFKEEKCSQSRMVKQEECTSHIKLHKTKKNSQYKIP